MVNIKELEKDDAQITEIESKLGKGEINEKDIQLLLDLVEAGYKNAFFTYGLYLLIEKGDEKEALKWLKNKSIKQ